MAKTPDITKMREARTKARKRAVAEARARAKEEAEERARANAEAKARADAEARAVIGEINLEAVVGTHVPPVVAQTGDTILTAPELQRVQPGDLITAQYINNLVAAVQNLQLRMDLIEGLDDDAQPGGDVA